MYLYIIFVLVFVFSPVLVMASQQNFLLPLVRSIPENSHTASTYDSIVKKKYSDNFQNFKPINLIEISSPPLNGVVWDDVEYPKYYKKFTNSLLANCFLSKSPHNDSGTSMARKLVTDVLNSDLQMWLSNFGSAHIQLILDKNFSFKNSNFDILFPFYEGKKGFLFTQSSLHRTDNRTQSNLGLGYRLFKDKWMLGGNTFIDYDLSQGHARTSLGIEYWRDFLKFEMNGYQRLTNWRHSRNIIDYEVRPASGWDIKAQGWIPTLPQLGGKVMYTKYFGHDFSSFNNNKFDHDLYTVTTEINYTPIPLLTLSAKLNQTKYYENNNHFGLDINYQFNVPLKQQLNPDLVSEMHQLTSMRYNLVERNNNIFLEYRDKEILRLKTADLVTGYSGEYKSLGVTVSSRYGLEHIDWSALSLISAGGKIIQNGNSYTVVLPKWNKKDKGLNSYLVSFLAVDKKGNVSNQTETRVIVNAPDVNKYTSTFTPAESFLFINGSNKQVLTLTVKNFNGQPVELSDITLDVNEPISASVSKLTSNEEGVYTATVTAGKNAETLILTPSIHGFKLNPATVVIVGINQEDSFLELNKNSYHVGEDIFVKAFLVDTEDTNISDSPSFLANLVNIPNATMKVGESWKFNPDGYYYAIYTAQSPGDDLKATMKLDGWELPVEYYPYNIFSSSSPKKESSVKYDDDSYIKKISDGPLVNR